MEHTFYSIRTGQSEHPNGLPLEFIQELLLKEYLLLKESGYFDEHLGFTCVDMGFVNGKIQDISHEISIRIRKKHLWPIENYILTYSEADLFDVIEFLYQIISKPIKGDYHSYNDCGTHWEIFDKQEGQKFFRERINVILELYENPFELAANGQILQKPEKGFEKLFIASIPSDRVDITSKIESAILLYRRPSSRVEERYHAIKDLIDVLELLRPKISQVLNRKDENALFDIANNFGLRHHNLQQKTDYEKPLWVSWLFYFYLSTIHLILRKMEKQGLL